MQKRKKWYTIAVLLVIAVCIHIFSDNSLRVENRYATSAYPPIAFLLRFLTGWIPFSLGDILYGIIAIWLLWKAIIAVIKLFKRKINLQSVGTGLLKTIIILLSVYILFNLMWGINYDRKGIAYQLQLTKQKYTSQQLKQLDSLLLQKVNQSKTALLKTNDSNKSSSEIFNESEAAYKNLVKEYSFIEYKKPSVKSSMWGWLGNYMGFSGYYNPFTGEAQVNTTVPYFLQPYTTCHEMAHQLGYAKEDEANFVGYLAATASSDTLFHYSVYLDLFLTANRNLFDIDSASARSFARQLMPEVKADIVTWIKFNAKHRNPVEPLVRWLYGKYLERNNQPSGLLSYDEVTGLLIGYYNKYGKI